MRSEGRRLLLVTGGVLVAAAIVALTFRVLLVLFGGVLYALVLHGAATWVARHLRVISYKVALAGIVGLGVTATIAAGIALAPALSRQVQMFTDELPRMLASAFDQLRQVKVVGAVPETNKIQAEPLARGAVTALGASSEVLAAMAIVFFVGVYGAAQPKVYRRAVLAAVSCRHRRRAAEMMHHAGKNLTRWMLGRLVAMLFVGVATGIAFWVLKIPLALTLAILAGLLTFVEYVGAVMSAVPPVLLAFTKSPQLAVAVLVLFTVIHVVEGYLLTPLLARASVRIPPAFSLGTQVVLAALVGVLGLTFSTPLLVVALSAFESRRPVARSRPGRGKAPRLALFCLMLG